MFQVNATLAIIMSFLVTFVDELGEMGELSLKKAVLIGLALLVGYFIYKSSSDNESGEMVSVDIDPRLKNNVKSE